jgi:hypothetical protein
MWYYILSIGIMLSQSLFSISMASVCSDDFPLLKLHTTTLKGFYCHYIRKMKWLSNLAINSQLMFGIFKYSACKHERLQHFGNIHRMKVNGQLHSVTSCQTLNVKKYFKTAFLIMYIYQIKCVYLYFKSKNVLFISNYHHVLNVIRFIFGVGPEVTHQMYCSLSRLIVLSPL